MKLLVFIALIGVAVAQTSYRPFGGSFGFTTQAPRYQPFSFSTQPPRYQPFRPVSPNTDGKYRAGNDGQYRASDDGKYRGGNDGKYSGAGGKYNGDNSGQYSGVANPYQHQGDKVRTDGAYKPSPTTAYVARPAAVGPTGSTYGRKIGYNNEGQWRIFRDVKHLDQDGYAYEYETENKIKAAEQGRLFNRGTDLEGMKASGFYEYVGDDGNTYRVDYTADENGFQPVGAHLPTPPPVPEAIQRALAYVAARNAK